MVWEKDLIKKFVMAGYMAGKRGLPEEALAEMMEVSMGVV